MPIGVAEPEAQYESLQDPFAVHLPALMVVNKAHQIQNLAGELEVFQ